MSTSLVHPLPGYRLTDGFGWREAIPGVVGAGGHTGQDIAAPQGTPIRAANSGTARLWFDVFKKNNAPAGGNMVGIIGQGVETRYAHLDRYAVKNGQHVTAGQILGYVGNTGAAVGYHLHYEVLINGRYVNPLPYLTATPTPTPKTTTEEETMKAIYYKAGKTFHVAVIDSTSGLFAEYNTTSPDYNRTVKGLGTGTFVRVTKGHYNALKADFAKARTRK